MLEEMESKMVKYFGAVEEFSKSAREFLKHVHLLPQALNARREALAVSAELRAILDNGDERMRTIMSELEQAVSGLLDNTTLSEKKQEKPEKPDAVKVEAMKASAGGIGVVKTFP